MRKASSLCQACRRTAKRNASRQYSQLAFAPQIAHLTNRSILELSGPDAQKFLKGVTCKDVEKLGGGYSGFLNAAGRILHTVFILPVPRASIPTYLVIHDDSPDHPAPLLSFLPPFKLRSKVKIRDVSDQWDIYTAWEDTEPTESSEPSSAPSRSWKFGSGGAAEVQWSWNGEIASPGLGEGEVGCYDLRAGFGPGSLGRRILVRKGANASLTSSHDMVLEEEYHLRRMSLGVPEGSSEIVPGVALPLESCMDIHGGVDFRKGCYLGQELTVRTYHTGATRKRILPLRLRRPDDAQAPIGENGTMPQLPSEAITSGIDITFHPPLSSASKKPRSAGRLLALHNSVTTVGLGLVRLEMAEKACWLGPNANMEDSGRLTVSLNGQEWAVDVGKGEAYGAALEQLKLDAA